MALRRILSFFRRDKKEDFARYKELIDNKVVGNNPLRQQMRDYLISEKIMRFRGEPLYYIDMERLEQAGINWTALRRSEPNPKTIRFIEKFLQWRNAK